MMQTHAFADPPSAPPSLENCLFYQSIELPGLGTLRGQWDLRPGIDVYLGPTDFDGLRVLEIGTANGFVCFELERRGANVVAVDLPADGSYDARPGAEGKLEPGAMQAGLERIRNAFWLAHHLLKSDSKVVYAHANHLPDIIGRFDVVVLANVLQHLRDPIGVLCDVSRLADSIVVTEADWMGGIHEELAGMVLFTGSQPYSWFQVKPPLLTVLLAEMGFTRQHLDRHEQLLMEDLDFEGSDPRSRTWGGSPIPHFTLTARRARDS